MSVVRFGLAGKLPAHGDFVRRGSPTTVSFLDDWLTGELAELSGEERHALLERWPLWMFAATRTPVGDVAGALCASHDCVGRLFPLTVFVEGAAPATLAGWAMAIGEVLREIPPVIAADALMEAVRAIDVPAACGTVPPPGSIWWRSPEQDNVLTLPAMPRASDLMTMLAEEPA